MSSETSDFAPVPVLSSGELPMSALTTTLTLDRVSSRHDGDCHTPPRQSRCCSLVSSEAPDSAPSRCFPLVSSRCQFGARRRSSGTRCTAAAPRLASTSRWWPSSGRLADGQHRARTRPAYVSALPSTLSRWWPSSSLSAGCSRCSHVRHSLVIIIIIINRFV